MYWCKLTYLRDTPGEKGKDSCLGRTDEYQVALKARGIDKLLEEAREDNKENDATHMGRRK